MEALAGFDRRSGGFEEAEKMVFGIVGTLAPRTSSLLNKSQKWSWRSGTFEFAGAARGCLRKSWRGR